MYRMARLRIVPQSVGGASQSIKVRSIAWDAINVRRMSYRTTRRTFMSRFALHIEAYSVGSFRLDLKACYDLSISAKDASRAYQWVHLPAAV